jgi:hypothetical protein
MLFFVFRQPVVVFGGQTFFAFLSDPHAGSRANVFF